MNNRAEWWIPLVVPPLQLLRHLLSGLYAVTFAPLDKRAGRKRESRFAVDVSAALAAVLGKDAYRVIANFGTIFPPGFDYAYTTVERHYLSPSRTSSVGGVPFAFT